MLVSGKVEKVCRFHVRESDESNWELGKNKANLRWDILLLGSMIYDDVQWYFLVLRC
jgi:hypothetical protein